MGKKNTPAVRPEHELAVYDYGEDAGKGYGKDTASETVIPFLKLLQGLSPEVTDNKPEGARAGLMLNTATDELAEEFLFLPFFRQHLYTEWIPLDKGGGLVGRHDDEAEVVQIAKRAAAKAGHDPRYSRLYTYDDKQERDNELVETFYVYGFLCDEEGRPKQSVVIAFKSTKITVWRDWRNKAKHMEHKPPLYACLVKLGVEQQTNKAQQKFFNFTITTVAFLDPKNDQRYTDAREQAERVEQGLVQADFANEDAGVSTNDDTTPPF